MRQAPMLPLFLLSFAACTTGDDDSDSSPITNSRVELADIFISDRLVEIPLLPSGTTVHREILIHNAGDKPLSVNGIELNYQSDANWSVELAQVPSIAEPLVIDAHEFISVEVIYLAVEGHDTFAALDVYSDDPDEAEMTVAFVGRSGTGGPEAHVSRNIIDFGFQYRALERRQLFQLDNDGSRDLWITSVELIQSDVHPVFSLVCPGVYPADSCDFSTEILPGLLAEPVVPGSGQLFEVSFVPDNLQSASAQIRITTSDPIRPEFMLYLLGNGQSAVNCTPPTVTVTYPDEAAFYHPWEVLQITARLHDQEQPPGSMYVEMFLGDLLIEDEFPDENGIARFAVDLGEHEPPVPPGLQTFTLKVTDGCQLYGYDVAVAGIEFPLSQSDVDGDGYDGSQGDCDENDPDRFPQAIEVHNGKDDDCDGTVDEQTAVWDDDCDGYCENTTVCLGQGPAPIGDVLCTGLAEEPYGDCNDGVYDIDHDGVLEGPNIHPGLHETLNFVDDNCDGTVDEGTTFSDDDGDGQTEAVGDCDDNDAETFRGALEWCDGVDDDCDGDIDDSCADPSAPPRVIGGIITDEFQVRLGDATECDILVVSPDPQVIYEWTSDGGTYDQPAAGSHVIWRAPEDNDENGTLYNGKFATLMVRVVDSLGQQTYGFGNVLMREEITIDYSPVVGSGAGQGPPCGSNQAVGAGSAWGALVFGLLATRRRRA